MSDDNFSAPLPPNPSSTTEADRILWEPPKPNWDGWKSVKQAKLWVAVALARNIEPKHFDYFRTGKLDTKFTQQPPQFTSLLTLAINNISANGVLKPIVIDWDSLSDSEIRFSNFVKWAKSFKVELPPNFPGTTAHSSISKDQSSSDENERSILLTLIAVFAEELKLDITYPSKTAGLIEDLTTRVGARVSARAIENHLKRIGIAVNKPLREKERSTLLFLIAALAMELDIDTSKTSKAAGLIEGLTMRHGSRVEASTIEEHLKRIPRALEKRSL
ncbi:MAG: hypothetical protein KJ889_03890 [Gammaproteobacteria bacterium]|nr:hypothetical protein [Gammaproteobacteria bacterium]